MNDLISLFAGLLMSLMSFLGFNEPTLAAPSIVYIPANQITSASSTIGDGTQAGGLTINGGATTTGNMIVQGTGTSTFAGSISISTSTKGNALYTGWHGRPLVTANTSGTVLYVGPTRACTTIQCAVDRIPYIIDDGPWRIELDAGTYNEDVLVGQTLTRWIPVNDLGEHYPLQIRGGSSAVTSTTTASSYKVKSILINTNVGAIPIEIENIEITGTSPYDNETSGIVVYGGAAEIKFVYFSAGTNGITCYGARCDLTGVDFGTSLTGGAIRVKHGGFVTIDVSYGVHGSTVASAYFVDQGQIFFRGGATSTLTSSGSDLVNPQNGLIYDTERGIFYGTDGFTADGIVGENAFSLLPEGLFDSSLERAWILHGSSTERTLRMLVNNDSFTKAEIELENNNTADGNIYFKTSTDSADAVVRATITHDGKLGVGNVSPTELLNVQGEAAAQFLTATSTSATSTFAGGLTVDTTDFVVDPDGNRIGIGTASPAAELEIATADGIAAVRLTDTAGTDSDWEIRSHNSSPASGLTIWGGVVGSESTVLTINPFPSGNSVAVGISSSTPWAKLTVQQTGTGNAPAFIVEDQAADTSPFIIDQTGNVGIGTTTPGSILSIQGVANFVANATSTLYNSLYVQGNLEVDGLTFDHIFDEWKQGTLAGVDEIRTFVLDEGHLPFIDKAHDEKQPLNVSRLLGQLWESVERAWVILFEHEDRIDALEKRIAELERRCSL